MKNKILILSVILIAIISFVSCSKRSVESTHQPSNQTNQTLKSNNEQEKNIRQQDKPAEKVKKISEDEVVPLLAKYFFSNDITGLSYDGVEEETGYYMASWANSGGGTGAGWYIDSYTGDLYDFEHKKLANLLEESEKSIMQNNSKTINNAVQGNNGKKQSVDTIPKDLFSYVVLTKKEVLNKLGMKYKIVQTGAEGSYEGYEYESLGLTFVFEAGKVAWIDCDEKVKISGAKTGMNFMQIFTKLGEAKVVDTWFETEDNKAYKIEYIIQNCKVVFFSFNKDGTESELSIYPKNN